MRSATAERTAAVRLKTGQPARHNTNIPPGNPKRIAIIRGLALSYRAHAAEPALCVKSKPKSDRLLGPVYIHRVQRTVATMLIIAAKHLSVFS